MNTLYICNTYYHIYIAILKSINDKKNNINSEIIICDQINNYRKLSQKIKESKIFTETYLLNEKDLKKKIFKNNRRIGVRLLWSNNRIEKVYNNIEFINRIYECNVVVFNDTTIFAHYLYKKIDNYKIIEDGLRTYQNLNYLFLRKILFAFFKSPIYLKDGRYSKASVIEVTDPDLITDERREKIIELPLKEYLNNLNLEEKQKIMNIFDFKLLMDNSSEKKILILTQPLYQDNILSENGQKELYKKIIKKYSNNYKVYIKKHPRDEMSYNEISSDIILINHNMPSEVLNLLNDNFFDIAIAAYSTSINNLTIANKKVNLFNSIEQIKEKEVIL